MKKYVSNESHKSYKWDDTLAPPVIKWAHMGG